MKFKNIFTLIISVICILLVSISSFADEISPFKNPPSPDTYDPSTATQQPIPVEESRVDISIQFVDENGEAIPNLFVYWEKNDYYFDYSLYTGSPTNNEGIWKYLVKPGKTRFVVRNINSTLEQIEESYEIDVPENGNKTTYKLIWTNRTPKQLVDEKNHKLIVHFEDAKGKPAVGLEVSLITSSNVKPQPGQKINSTFGNEPCAITGFTDKNGNFTTNLHDDGFYLVVTNDPKFGIRNHIDATGGGTIEYTIKAS